MNQGFLLALCAHLIWGFAALYWVQTEPVSAVDLVAHRALWSFLLLLALLLATRRLRFMLELLRQPKTVLVLTTSAAAQACNWGIFLWAVSHGRATEASLGYFLLPLVNVAFGLLILRESIDRPQAIAVGLAGLGVANLVLHFGGLPLVALGLSMSFGIYSLVRKLVRIEPVEGMAVETALMAPAAFAWMMFTGGAGFGEHGLRVDLFLLGASVMTTLPLLLYVAASHRLALTAMGITFYIGPSCQLVVALAIFREPVSGAMLASFMLVWLGLAIIVMDTFRRYRSVRILQRE